MFISDLKEFLIYNLHVLVFSYVSICLPSSGDAQIGQIQIRVLKLRLKQPDIY